MQSKIIIGGLCGVFFVGAAVLAQTNDADLQTNSNNPKQYIRQTNLNALINTTAPVNRSRRNENYSQSNISVPERTTSEPVDFACQYLTPAAAQKVLGGKVYLNGTLSSFVDKNFYCNYSVDDQKTSNSQFARIDIKTFSTAEQARAANQVKIKSGSLLNAESQPRGAEIKDVPGIGDGAKLIIRSDNSVSFYFQKNETAFEITVLSAPGRKINTGFLKRIAREAVKSF